MNIRTLLFDMGNVLVHFSHELMCRQIADLLDVELARIRELLFSTGLQWQFECGRLSEGAFHTQLQDLVGQNVPLHELRRAGSDIFELNEPLVPVLDELKSQGHRLVLLSNTSIAHLDWVRRHFDVLERFDDLVVSYEVGAIKPDPAMYEAALKRIQCRAAECFYTDDVAEYVETGRSFGLQAEQFTDVRTLVSQLRLRGISLKTVP